MRAFILVSVSTLALAAPAVAQERSFNFALGAEIEILKFSFFCFFLCFVFAEGGSN